MHNIINTDYINQNDKNLVEEFIHNPNIKKYILGINKLSKSVLKYIKVDGIIDDFTRVQSSRKKDLVSLENIEKDAIILWVATGSPLEVKNRLDTLGYQNISYLSFYKYSELELAEPPFIVDFEKNFQDNKSQYKKTYDLLSDEKSKEVFF